MYNLYKKDRKIPLLWFEDYTDEIGLAIGQLIQESDILVLLSIADHKVISKIRDSVLPNKWTMQYIFVETEFFCVLFKDELLKPKLWVKENDLLNINMKGHIIVGIKFKNVPSIVVAHLYHWTLNEKNILLNKLSNGNNIIMTSIDPVY